MLEYRLQPNRSSKTQKQDTMRKCFQGIPSVEVNDAGILRGKKKRLRQGYLLNYGISNQPINTVITCS